MKACTGFGGILKKGVAACCVAALLPALAACGAGQPAPAASVEQMDGAASLPDLEQAVVTEHEPDLVEMGTELFDFCLLVDGEAYALPCPVLDFVVRGWTPDAPADGQIPPGQYADAVLEKDGKNLPVRVVNPAADALPLQECYVAGVMAAQAETAPDFVALPGGITPGQATRQDVLDAYGAADIGYEPDGGKLKYTLDRDAYAHFVFDGEETLAGLELWNLAGGGPAGKADGEGGLPGGAPVALPAELAALYTAPDALGQSWEAFTILYGGKLYALPAPVAEFLADGWLLRDEGEVEPGGWLMRVSLQKGNQVLRTTLHNYSGEAQPLENCFVTMAECATTSVNVPLELPGGVTLESTSAQVMEAWGYPHATDMTSARNWEMTYYSGEGMIVLRFYYADGENPEEMYDLEVWNHPAALGGLDGLGALGAGETAEE